MNPPETDDAWPAIQRRIVDCDRCPELRAYTAEVARVRRRAYRDETYWGRPVPSLGDASARCALVGLAPGAHGSNRTGRMFTGDASGDWLFRALHRAGFANRPVARDAHDGLRLHDCVVTAVLHCAPPQNRPTREQERRCAPYLDEEFAALGELRVVVGLGKIGTEAALAALRRAGYDVPRLTFAHGASVRAAPPGLHGAGERGRHAVSVIASYHPSRQNTQTGRLTEPMLDRVFAIARSLLDDVGPP